jgi:hypothetical protein
MKYFEDFQVGESKQLGERLMSREDIIERVGRSPDRASAVILAAIETPKVPALRYLDQQVYSSTSVTTYDPLAGF